TGRACERRHQTDHQCPTSPHTWAPVSPEPAPSRNRRALRGGRRSRFVRLDRLLHPRVNRVELDAGSRSLSLRTSTSSLDREIISLWRSILIPIARFFRFRGRFRCRKRNGLGPDIDFDPDRETLSISTSISTPIAKRFSISTSLSTPIAKRFRS